jgi:hypothetical protein
LKILARETARWAADSREALSAADPDTGTLVNRVADNWRPLLAIADLAGDEWPGFARTIAETAETGKQDQSKRSMVLRDIRDYFAAHPAIDRVRSMDLAYALGKLESRPWSEWRNGKPMTPAVKPSRRHMPLSMGFVTLHKASHGNAKLRFQKRHNLMMAGFVTV